MIFPILIVISKCFMKADHSFVFTKYDKKQFILENPKKYINKNRNRIASYFKKETGQGKWYYVHFIGNDSFEKSKIKQINANDELIKNTFILFLNSNDLEQIANISLVKPIEPHEKYFNDENNADSEFLFIVTTASYIIPNNNEYFSIEKKYDESSFVVKIARSNLNEKEFIKRKKKIVDFFSEIPEVKSISNYKKISTNNALMAGFTQKNSYDFQKYNGTNFYYLERYLNNRGITGENQIITILDTPIDFQHAMFRDDNVPVEINKTLENHRKLIYYRHSGSLKDLINQMEENEHGTHVGGIAAGKSICENDEKGISYFNGIAPDAKILYAGNFNNTTPNELGKLMKIYNSKISSNSWGTKVFYNPQNYMYGKLAEENPDMTFIFSAGNEHSNGNFTVGEPGGSKNILTVGSVDDFYEDVVYRLENKNDPRLYINVIGYFIKDPWFEGTIGDRSGFDIVYINADKGKNCDLVKKNKVLAYGINVSWINDCDLNGVEVLWTNQINDAKNFIEKTVKITASRIFIMNATKKIKQTWYSSTGPANKGILKPDVMAPGTSIISAKSRAHSSSPHGCRDDGEKDFTLMDGTSMACPNVAGAVALVHQYFLSGKWIDNVQLDGATTRALLINSCRHPLDSKTPDITFGHGVVDLSTILPIENHFGVQITHPNGEEKSMVTENGHVVSKLKVDLNLSNKKLQITLSYIDKMLNMDSPLPLTRDIDLIVVSPSKKVYYGDHLNNKDTQHASTNEKVIIDEYDLENGEYTIHVYGGKFVDNYITGQSTKQEFAVVATGPIENGYLTFKDSFECPCDSCDSQHPGKCLCDEKKEVGPMCQVKVTTVTGDGISLNLDPLEIKRIRFVSNKKINYVYAESKNPGVDSSFWVSRNCHSQLGEYDGTTYISKDISGIKVNYGTNEICVAVFSNNDITSNFHIEVSNSAKKNWLFINLLIIAAILIILVIALMCLCICGKGKGCCKCCKRKIMDDRTASSTISILLQQDQQ